MTSVSDFFNFTHAETSDFDKFSDIQVATFELRVFLFIKVFNSDPCKTVSQHFLVQCHQQMKILSLGKKSASQFQSKLPSNGPLKQTKMSL